MNSGRFHVGLMNGMCDWNEPFYDTFKDAHDAVMKDVAETFKDGTMGGLPYIITERLDDGCKVEVFCYEGTYEEQKMQYEFNRRVWDELQAKYPPEEREEFDEFFAH